MSPSSNILSNSSAPIIVSFIIRHLFISSSSNGNDANAVTSSCYNCCPKFIINTSRHKKSLFTRIGHLRHCSLVITPERLCFFKVYAMFLFVGSAFGWIVLELLLSVCGSSVSLKSGGIELPGLPLLPILIAYPSWGQYAYFASRAHGQHLQNYTSPQTAGHSR